MTDLDTAPLNLGTPEFWRRPLAARMTDFALLREAERFPYTEYDNFLIASTGASRPRASAGSSAAASPPMARSSCSRRYRMADASMSTTPTVLR